jgi:hypothetical protein
MGIRTWLSKLRKDEDATAIRRAEDVMRGASPQERERLSGDMEGLAADERAARGASEQSVGDSDGPRES